MPTSATNELGKHPSKKVITELLENQQRKEQACILSSGGIVTLLFSLTISIREDRVLFLLIHLTGVSCFHSSSLILSSFPTFLNWRDV